MFKKLFWVQWLHSLHSGDKLLYVYEVLCTCTTLLIFISSPEWTAQVSFLISKFSASSETHGWFRLLLISSRRNQPWVSDDEFSVVRHCHCHKLFTFSSSSPEPLTQFQPNLAQSIFGWRGYEFIEMKGYAHFQGEIISK